MIKAVEDLELISQLESAIPEFESHYSVEKIRARLDNRKHLALVAYDGERPVAYKVGYQETPNRFYSWIGGVLPDSRRKGWARKLLHTQEKWCREQGYGADVVGIVQFLASIIVSLVAWLVWALFA